MADKTLDSYIYDFVDNLTFGIPDIIGKATGWWDTASERDSKTIDQDNEKLNDAIVNYYQRAADNLQKQVEEYQKQTEAYVKSLELQNKTDNAKAQVEKAYNDLTAKVTSLLNSAQRQVEQEVESLLSKANNVGDAIASLVGAKAGRSTFSTGREKINNATSMKSKEKQQIEDAANKAKAKAQEYQATSEDLINQSSFGNTETLKTKLVDAGSMINQAVDTTPIKRAESTLSNIINGGSN